MSDLFGESVVEAKARVMREAEKDGTCCPVCDGFVKVYRRKLNSGMARALIAFYKADKAAPGEWSDIAKGFLEGMRGDYSKLAYWNLLERHPRQDRPDHPHAGLWRITLEGKEFVAGLRKVWSHVYVYNDTPLKYDELERIGIQDALGRHFDYWELMAA